MALIRENGIKGTLLVIIKGQFPSVWPNR